MGGMRKFFESTASMVVVAIYGLFTVATLFLSILDPYFPPLVGYLALDGLVLFFLVYGLCIEGRGAREGQGF